MSLEIDLPPNATNLISSLRGIGYDTQSALGDIVDNSISASATSIDIFFNWNNGDCNVLVLDNGHGMERAQLLEAMRFSSSNVNDKRDSRDLGRFGMGLKSASLSQGKILKVFSKKQNTISGMAWNLSKLEQQNENRWMLDELEATSSEFVFYLRDKESGTLVVWEELDRIFTIGFGQRHFLDLIDKVEDYLSVTFESFINKGLSISINGKEVKPRNPLETELSYYTSPTENIGSFKTPIKIKTYLYVPKANSFSTKCLFYRGERLISENTLLDLTLPTQLRKNTIIKLELGNDNDHEWNLDITKSKINIPSRYRKPIETHLKIVSENILKTVRKKPASEISDEIWIRKSDAESIFKINRSSKVIENLACMLDQAQKTKFENVLEQLETDLYQPRTAINQENNLLTPEYQREVMEHKTENKSLDKEIKLHLLKRMKSKSISLNSAKKSLIQSKFFEGYEANIEAVANLMENGESNGH